MQRFGEEVFPRLKIFSEICGCRYCERSVFSEAIQVSLDRETQKRRILGTKDISFELQEEMLGIAWQKRCRKKYSFRILSGILKQDYGSFEVNGSIGGIIALGAGFNLF